MRTPRTPGTGLSNEAVKLEKPPDRKVLGQQQMAQREPLLVLEALQFTKYFHTRKYKRRGGGGTGKEEKEEKEEEKRRREKEEEGEEVYKEED